MPFVTPLSDDSLLLHIQVQPRASRTELNGIQGEAIRVRLAAPPVDGKANQALLAYLAKLLSMPKTALMLKNGLKGRRKTVLIQGMNEATLRAILRPLL